MPVNLPDEVERAFSPGGSLAVHLPEFKPRASQVAMATAIARTLEKGGSLVVEAGTGVGKTWAYLVPAVLNGARVMVSTATKALQEQLALRDIPKLLSALSTPVNVAMLKGRDSYLCQYRLSFARPKAHNLDAVALQWLAGVERWAQSTQEGDLAEITVPEGAGALLTWLTSTTENCLGSRCPQLATCHVNRARQRAVAADLVVVNHHLFFAEMALRKSGMAEILPQAEVLVFDEAHRLNEAGLHGLAETVSTRLLHELAQDFWALGVHLSIAQASWHLAAADLRAAARSMYRCVAHLPVGIRLAIDGKVLNGVTSSAWGMALSSLSHALMQVLSLSEPHAEWNAQLCELQRRVQLQWDRLTRMTGPSDPQRARWLEILGGGHVQLVNSPLDIANEFSALRMRMAPAAEHELSWIFTSATLGPGGRTQGFEESCGLAGAESICLPSPFDYSRQAALYVTEALPPPSDVDHSQSVAMLAADMAVRLGGRTLVLTTSLRARGEIAQHLSAHFSESAEIEVLIEGQYPRLEMIRRFRQMGEGAGCILVASMSFWEGFDVPGAALQLVVIDKLPFAVPDDPLVAARSQRIQNRGGDAFIELSIPEAMKGLRQGAGRLIRQESDRGVLIVCDSRLVSKTYGATVLAALEPMRRLNNYAELVEAIQSLATGNP